MTKSHRHVVRRSMHLFCTRDGKPFGDQRLAYHHAAWLIVERAKRVRHYVHSTARLARYLRYLDSRRTA